MDIQTRALIFGAGVGQEPQGMGVGVGVAVCRRGRLRHIIRIMLKARLNDINDLAEYATIRAHLGGSSTTSSGAPGAAGVTSMTRGAKPIPSKE